MYGRSKKKMDRIRGQMQRARTKTKHGKKHVSKKNKRTKVITNKFFSIQLNTSLTII